MPYHAAWAQEYDIKSRFRPPPGKLASDVRSRPDGTIVRSANDAGCLPVKGLRAAACGSARPGQGEGGVRVDLDLASHSLLDALDRRL